MNRRVGADLILGIITLIWGSTFVLMRNTLDTLSTFQLLSLRFSVAAILLIVVFFKKLKKINWNIIKHGSLIGLMLCGSLVFQVWGLHYTTASNSSFITSLYVLMVPIIAALIFKQKVGRSSIIGILVAFIGIIFLNGGFELKFGFGELLTFLCAICVAFQIIFIEIYTKEDDSILLGIIQIAFSAICCSIGWGVTGFEKVCINNDIIITLFVTGVLATAVAFTAETYVQKFTSSTHTALIFSLEPVFGLMFALIIPDNTGAAEVITFIKIIGCFLILCGVLISELNLFKKKEKV